MEEVASLFECLQDKEDCEEKEEEMDTKSVDENIEDLSTSFFSEVSERSHGNFSYKSRVNDLYAKKKTCRVIMKNCFKILF